MRAIKVLFEENITGVGHQQSNIMTIEEIESKIAKNRESDFPLDMLYAIVRMRSSQNASLISKLKTKQS